MNEAEILVTKAFIQAMPSIAEDSHSGARQRSWTFTASAWMLMGTIVCMLMDYASTPRRHNLVCGYKSI